MKVAHVGAIDRSYEDDGTLTPRSIPGAVLHDPNEIAERAVRLVTRGALSSRGGREIPMQVDTVLLHGDGPDAVALARRVRKELEAAGVEIRPLHKRLRNETPT